MKNNKTYMQKRHGRKEGHSRLKTARPPCWQHIQNNQPSQTEYIQMNLLQRATLRY